MATKKTASTPKVYQLKIILKYIEPEIWRRVLVESDTSLEVLHLIVQEAMGWDNYHMHSWRIGNAIYSESQEEDFGLDDNDETTAILSEVIGSRRKKFSYTYDFGDSWEHEILVEKILPLSSDTIYPVCVAGECACPPEDCGGAWSYVELLSILKDPENPEYEEKMEWLEDNFDPNKFDLKEANLKLQLLSK